MIKWEYKEIENPMEYEMNAAGSQGWELCGISADDRRDIYVFKRPMANSPEVSPQELEKVLQSDSTLISNRNNHMKHIVTQEDIDENKFPLEADIKVGDEIEIPEETTTPEGETAE